MSKYFCCYFASYEELKAELKKVDNAYDAKVIAQCLEARNCLTYWINSAWERYFELNRI